MLAEYEGEVIPASLTTAAVSTLFAAPVETLPATLLLVEFIGQSPYNQLCWAACGAMLLTANGVPTTLQQATIKVNGSFANVSANAEIALQKFNLPYDVPRPVNAPITSAALVDQIVNGRKPVQVRWKNYQGDGGHVGLVTGYDPRSQTFCLCDPWFGPSWVTHRYLMKYNGSAYWLHTYYAIGGVLGKAS